MNERLSDFRCVIYFLQSLRLRLQQMSSGATALKAAHMLRSFPSKRLLLRFVSSFPSREDLSLFLEVCLHNAQQPMRWLRYARMICWSSTDYGYRGGFAS